MAKRSIRLGVLVPSSNTAVEPTITSILHTASKAIPSVHITVHFSRFRVTQISLDSSATAQFNLDIILQSVSLLADARVDAVTWAGTAAGWLGLETDLQLCNAIESKFSIPACTSTLALMEFLALLSNPHIGLVTPYIQEMNDAIRRNFNAAGISIARQDRCLQITDNQQIGAVKEDQLNHMVEQVLDSDHTLNVITVFCTNLKAAHLAKEWEQKYQTRDLIVLDSISIVVWALFGKVGVDTIGTNVENEWGRMFSFARK